MNDFDPSLDEIVSAYVDGAATPDERARVESDPALLERAATFRGIHDALAVPTLPADGNRRDALIARALADSTASGATVRTLRSRRSTALGPIVAAAAVIAMFFGLGTFLVASQDNDDAGDSSATAALDADSFESQGLRSPATSGAAEGGSAPQSAPTNESTKLAAGYLGAFAEETALRDALVRARDGIVQSTETTLSSRLAASVGDHATCGRNDPADAKVYAADMRGRPVTVVVSGARADVYDDVTCQRTTIELPSR